MIGEAIPRLEDRRFVTGNGRYTDDINVDGQAYAAFLRAPHAHAILRSIDVTAALAAPGVLAVLTGQDYVDAGFKGIDHKPDPVGVVIYDKPTFENERSGPVFNHVHMPLVVDKVRHVGEPIVMVIAETQAQARDATELVDIDYDVLPAAVSVEEALREGAERIWEGAPGNLCFRVTRGDHEAVKKVFAEAPHVVRRDFHNSRVVNCQMEPRAAIGCHDAAADSYTLISGSQGVSRQKGNLSTALKVPPDKMRVVCPDTGGGFGPRTMAYVEQLAVLWAAREVGRAVKWTSTRSEAFISDYQGRDAFIRAAMAFSDDGHILALDYEWSGNVGAQTVSYTPMANGKRVIPSVYHVPVMALVMQGVLSNTVPTAPYRGAGRPEAMHAMERMLDLAARQLKIDRVEIRRRNMITHDMLPYANLMGLTYDSGDFVGNMDRVLELADWDGFAARREAARDNGRLRGIAVANYIEAPVGATSERIQMTVLADGVVDVISGTQSTGQGHETTFAQVVVSQLGVPINTIRLRTGDTAFVRVGGGTHSDRSMRIGGTLLFKAAAQIIEAGKPTAAAMLTCDASGLEYKDGSYVDPQSKRSVALFDVARHIAEHGLAGDASTKSLTVTTDFLGRMPAHPTGAAVCELEIDPETGDVHLLNYASVDDVGKPINPLICDGQVHGGLAQGIGQALSEGYYVDHETGQVLSGSYMDYGVMRAGRIPPLAIELREDPTAGNPLGVKGGGESGITPATAVIFNAISDALGRDGNRELDMPATPDKIWNFIHLAPADRRLV